MARRALQPCNAPGCSVLTREKGGRCSQHLIPAWHRTKPHKHLPTNWKRIRASIMERDRRLCQPCRTRGYITRAISVDHIVSRSQGGGDDRTNLQAICKACHDNKTALESRQGRGG